ncbi:MAG TPA: potassium-transporting ATPase subunit C [Deltaproteobacteria bacterium]|nr:potassium-transporting ATPase subunit C [Deltaproteobacteria bacterium]
MKNISLKRELACALLFMVLSIAVLGFIYPLCINTVSGLLFDSQARGSFTADESGRPVGSTLLAQRFTDPAYFHPRPSAAGDNGYDAASSGGSNLGPTSEKLRRRVENEIMRLRKENPHAPPYIPVELVTTSASGLDPHLTIPGALWQVSRIASARGISEERVTAMVEANREGRTWGVLGEPRVNVLLLNLALDRQFGKAGQRAIMGDKRR